MNCKSQHETSESGIIILVAFGFLGLSRFLLIELGRPNELSSFLKTVPLRRPEYFYSSHQFKVGIYM